MKFPVLMYHKVENVARGDGLMVTTAQLESQFLYLKKKRFNTISLSMLIDHAVYGKPLPENPILISFDDGYKNNFTFLYPLLTKYNLKANIFLVADFIQTGKQANGDGYLHIKDINTMSQDVVEFGFHTYDHKSYARISIKEIEQDIYKMQQRFAELKIACQPCFAYAYGAFTRKDKEKQEALEGLFRQFNIQLAFRIGNRMNILPLKNKFLIQRIDVTGHENLWKFKLMCTLGKKWLPF